MEKLLLITATDQLEAFLIEAILQKNEIASDIQVIDRGSKRKYHDKPESANVFVDKKHYEKAFLLMETIKKERLLHEEKKEETQLFSKKQLFFAITTTVIFLGIVIWVVVYAMT